MVSATFRHLIWYIWWRCQSLVAMKSVVRKNVQDMFVVSSSLGDSQVPLVVKNTESMIWAPPWRLGKQTNVMTFDGISWNWWQEQAHETCSECFCCMLKLWLPVDVPFKLFSDSIQLCISGFLVTLFSLVNQSFFYCFHEQEMATTSHGSMGLPPRNLTGQRRCSLTLKVWPRWLRRVGLLRSARTWTCTGGPFWGGTESICWSNVGHLMVMNGPNLSG